MSIKNLALIALAIIPISSFAAYTAKVPLEVLQGGNLPTGSIVIGDGSSPTDEEPAESNCEYNRSAGTYVAYFSDPDPFLPYSAGDAVYLYRGEFIGYNITGYFPNLPVGLSMGKKMDTDPELGSDSYEICSNNLSSYPPVDLPDMNGGPSEPEDPRITACYDKESQVISIIESYGSSLRNLSAYLDTDEDIVYCTADYNLPDGQARTDVINDLEAIGVGTAM